MLRSAFLFYSIGRYDVKGKQLLKTLGQNYNIDMNFAICSLVIAMPAAETSSRTLYFRN